MQTANDYNERKTEFESEEQKKYQILRSQEEGSAQMLGKQRDHGTIIMTIENLEKKLLEGGQDFILSKTDEEISVDGKDLNETERKALRSLQQLDLIEGFANLFTKFKDAYEGPINEKLELSKNKNWEPASKPDSVFNRVRDYLKKQKRVVEYEELERINALK